MELLFGSKLIFVGLPSLVEAASMIAKNVSLKFFLTKPGYSAEKKLKSKEKLLASCGALSRI
jgi:hypothetical protein